MSASCLLADLWASGESCIALASLLFACSGVLVKLTSPQLPILETCALPAAGCVLVIYAAALLSNTHHRLLPRGGRTKVLVAMRAVCGAATMLCLNAAIQLAGVSDATALFFTTPMFALLLECLLHSRLPGRGSVLGAAMTSLGALLVSELFFCRLLGGSLDPARSFCMATASAASGGGDSGGGGDPGGGGGIDPEDEVALMRKLAGLVLAVAAALASALSMVIVSQLRGAASAATLTLWNYSATAVTATASQLLLLLPAAAMAGGGPLLPVLVPPAFILPSPRDSLLLLGITFAQLAGLTLLNRGYSVTTATRGSSVNVLEVVFSFALDFWVLGHPLTVPSLLGGSLIVSGVLLLAGDMAAGSVGRDEEDERLLMRCFAHKSATWEEEEGDGGVQRTAGYGGKGGRGLKRLSWMESVVREAKEGSLLEPMLLPLSEDSWTNGLEVQSGRADSGSGGRAAAGSSSSLTGRGGSGGPRWNSVGCPAPASGDMEEGTKRAAAVLESDAVDGGAGRPQAAATAKGGRAAPLSHPPYQLLSQSAPSRPVPTPSESFGAARVAAEGLGLSPPASPPAISSSGLWGVAGGTGGPSRGEAGSGSSVGAGGGRCSWGGGREQMLLSVMGRDR